MINDIVNGISNALYEQFGTDYKIYTENVEQGLEEPCFFLAVLEARQARIIGNRYAMTVQMDVHYFPATQAKKKEMLTVAQKLYAILQRLPLLNGDMLNGFDLRWEAVEDVLHFFVTYKPIVRYETEADSVMEEAEVVSVGVKGGD